ncbi:hypothetical protein [Puniceicoccus vermicola]|uniref:Uncharacterized protein n=1 Tax=Puniceicoccus vermicola TaxID=388746 RepID=A0A7X1E4Q3_9BACT|nr:hypothetical protein [Puniceicoccus vermicola]MBC2602299.1 hypothetical protein [Puniceicoccus vermicola]
MKFNSPLDHVDYSRWFTDSVTLDFNSFVLSTVSGKKSSGDFRRVHISSSRCHYFSAFNEFARNQDDPGGHVIFHHTDSHLLNWIEDYTTIFATEVKREDVQHYSVLLSDNIFHFVSSDVPTIVEEI